MKAKAFTVWMAIRPAGQEAEHNGLFTRKAKAFTVWMAIRPAGQEAGPNGIFIMKRTVTKYDNRDT